MLDHLPSIIQGGMGIGVSDYRLARAVAKAGGLGVVSGTAIDTIMVRRLQLGDASGDVRRALAHFPFERTARHIIDTYFIEGGKAEDAPFRLLALPNVRMSSRRLELMVAANFVEVFLAKEGHGGPVGINYLEKIATPTLPSLLGALLAGVDVVLMGAGIPTQIPGILDQLAAWREVELRLSVSGNTDAEPVTQHLDPNQLLGRQPYELQRPKFLGIVASHVIAKSLLKKASGKVDGFVIEDHTAGGHNAPPRKKGNLSSEPNRFGPLDAPDLAAFRGLGVPFWLAGSYGAPEKLAQALALGAAGVQVGTAFAYCEESAVAENIKRDILQRARNTSLRVITDFEASPTGYPFKVIVREDAESELGRLRARERVCDLGYLRQTVRSEDGKLVYRCPGEPVDAYVDKGGRAEDTVHKLCLCNQLLATVGLGQVRGSESELPLLTAGEELNAIARFLQPGASSYSAADVLSVLSAGAAEARPAPN